MEGQQPATKWEYERFGWLIHDSHRKANICLLKYSHDGGRKKDPIQTIQGRDYGPDSLMRFLPDVGVIANPAYPREHQTAFSKLTVGKFPEVKPNKGRQVTKTKLSRYTFALEEYHDQLAKELVGLYRTDTFNQRYIVTGTSNELVYPMLDSYFNTERFPKQPLEESAFKVGVIHTEQFPQTRSSLLYQSKETESDNLQQYTRSEVSLLQPQHPLGMWTEEMGRGQRCQVVRLLRLECQVFWSGSRKHQPRRFGGSQKAQRVRC